MNLNAEHYDDITFVLHNNILFITVNGKGKWEGLTACGSYRNMTVSEGECVLDFDPPVLTFIPDGSVTYIMGSNVVIEATDQSIDASSLKYAWTDSEDALTEEKYINTFISGSTLSEIPAASGTYYLHAMARDNNGNSASLVRSFMLDVVAPVINVPGSNPVIISQGQTYIDTIATATDDIDNDVSVTSEGEVDTNIIGSYKITYTAADDAGNTSTATRIVNVCYAPMTYSYNGGQQTYTVPVNGTYKLEVWGAEGGGGVGGTTPGKGGYARGEIILTQGTILYVYVGQVGQTGGAAAYNGGAYTAYFYSGGGATHIATATGLLSSLISNQAAVLIVAGGGGGTGNNSTYGSGGAGGGTNGGGGSGISSGDNYAYGGGGGTQTTGGAAGTARASTGSAQVGIFGAGGKGYSSTSSAGGGGGGGWYGGGGGTFSTFGAAGIVSGGGGGSGYIGGVTNGHMENGQRSGSGYAVITHIGP